MGATRDAASSAVLTLPNALSFGRILAIPLFTWLMVRPGTEGLGLVAFGVVSATDWVDGWLARRSGRVSQLGKLLDPTADRLVIAAALAALLARGVFPAWAAALILVRDGALLVAGAALLVLRKVRIEVRRLGKVATMALMLGVPAVAWANLGLPLAVVARWFGWAAFWSGTAMGYAAAALYAGDVRRALAGRAGRPA
ncbi:MAG TPA: CDP-alcohol phosphatidyltransferase family protein [Actinomycetota bacterium]|nr:CDP-alcohol phosphatidyltransferase family protein [Actinomycetota bacterium]